MELWLAIPDYPNYEVSSNGRVKNKTTNKILKQADVKGYRRVVLCDEKGHHPKSVHRLVADTFLEWCTSSENRIHAFQTGLQRPSQNKHVKIVETGEQFDSMTDCAKHIQGDMKLISACIRGCQHTHRGYHFELVDIK